MLHYVALDNLQAAKADSPQLLRLQFAATLVSKHRKQASVRIWVVEKQMPCPSVCNPGCSSQRPANSCYSHEGQCSEATGVPEEVGSTPQACKPTPPLRLSVHILHQEKDPSTNRKPHEVSIGEHTLPLSQVKTMKNRLPCSTSGSKQSTRMLIHAFGEVVCLTDVGGRLPLGFIRRGQRKLSF